MKKVQFTKYEYQICHFTFYGFNKIPRVWHLLAKKLCVCSCVYCTEWVSIPGVNTMDIGTGELVGDNKTHVTLVCDTIFIMEYSRSDTKQMSVCLFHDCLYGIIQCDIIKFISLQNTTCCTCNIKISPWGSWYKVYSIKTIL